MCARLMASNKRRSNGSDDSGWIVGCSENGTNFAHRLVRSETSFQPLWFWTYTFFGIGFPNSTGLNIKAPDQRGYNPGILRMARRKAYASSKVLIPAARFLVSFCNRKFIQWLRQRRTNDARQNLTTQNDAIRSWSRDGGCRPSFQAISLCFRRRRG
jgi:hypothetical protein